jgi:hypothetical protein
MVKLNVPLFGQPMFYQCVPTCVKMVLEYARQQHGSKIPRLSIKTIARVIGTTIDGTAPKSVEKINERIREAQPSVEFETKFLGSFPEIVEELEERKLPVIVWINCVEPPAVVWHAVVVTGFDPETNTVFLNDPDGNVEKTMEVGVFNQRWGVIKRLVKVLIGRIQQRYINEWTTNIENREIGE